jgi:metal-sulfur cluster biosynthetic enzyme
MVSDREKQLLVDQVIEVAKTCFDPEIPVNIWEMGFIYKITITDAKEIEVVMTLTSPNCPAIKSLPNEFRKKLIAIPDVLDARIQLTFDPPYSQDFMSDEAKLTLGLL